jgi:EAL domain-containing protein (putative c-di-GMP-specific phosphodiesterase class I)/CheY-like chemotaxis protein
MLRGAAFSRDLARDLAQAIDQGQLQVHYQPIVDLATGSIREVEALARWEHPRWGMIPPSDFIPLAERHELILPLGQWVLETACRQARTWQTRLVGHPPITMNVNLSVKQVRQPMLVENVRRTLDETNLDAKYLHLEVTESLLLRDRALSLATFNKLRDLGVTIAIDDFGTGYSALSYLSWMPATVLKLDRSFIRRLGRNERDGVIVSGVISIARSLGLTVIGEGVETETQCAHLRGMGCDRGQGYYFARPMPPEQLTEMIRHSGSLAAPFPLLTAGRVEARPAGLVSRDILVIDDDDHIRDLTSLILELEGYQVMTASDGASALQQIQRQMPGVILLDMWMPGMDGWAFTKAYHQLPGPHAPIVVVTANPSPSACASQVGARTHISKPFELSQLLATISDIVPTPRS